MTPIAPRLRVDPRQVDDAGRPLVDAGISLHAAIAVLAAAWRAAAQGLGGELTGQALAACESGVVAAAAACVQSLEELGGALQRAAAAYSAAETQAVPPPRPVR